MLRFQNWILGQNVFLIIKTISFDECEMTRYHCLAIEFGTNILYELNTVVLLL
jgi:hypothetical protein